MAAISFSRLLFFENSKIKISMRLSRTGAFLNIFSRVPILKDLSIINTVLTHESHIFVSNEITKKSVIRRKIRRQMSRFC